MIDQEQGGAEQEDRDGKPLREACGASQQESEDDGAGPGSCPHRAFGQPARQQSKHQDKRQKRFGAEAFVLALHGGLYWTDCEWHVRFVSHYRMRRD